MFDNLEFINFAVLTSSRFLRVDRVLQLNKKIRGQKDISSEIIFNFNIHRIYSPAIKRHIFFKIWVEDYFIIHCHMPVNPGESEVGGCEGVGRGV